MPRVSGSLSVVTEEPELVSEVMVRAPRIRTHGDGLITPSGRPEPVRGGRVDFTVAPGEVVMSLMSAGMPTVSIPLLVGDEDISLAKAADLSALSEEDQDRLTRLAQEVASSVDEVRRAGRELPALRDEARDHADRSEQAAIDAEGQSEQAAQSERAAGQALAVAESARDEAIKHAGEAAQSAASSAESRVASEKARAEAEAHATSASASEEAAGQALAVAESARDEAQAAASSAKVGIDPDSVTKPMLTPELRGEIDGKADMSVIEPWAQSVSEDIADLNRIKADRSDIPSVPPHSALVEPDTLVQRDSGGQVMVPKVPNNDGAAASKAYVDEKAGGEYTYWDIIPTDTATFRPSYYTGTFRLHVGPGGVGFLYMDGTFSLSGRKTLIGEIPDSAPASQTSDMRAAIGPEAYAYISGRRIYVEGSTSTRERFVLQIPGFFF